MPIARQIVRSTESLIDVIDPSRNATWTKPTCWLREVMAAADLLRDDFGVDADVWSAPSFNELARDGQAVERWNRLHPTDPPRQCHVERCLGPTEGPIVAATDYVRIFAEQIHPYVPRRYVVLGTDGFGRSDSRAALRGHFEVDRYHVAVAALKALADEGTVSTSQVSSAIEKFGIDTEKPYSLYA